MHQALKNLEGVAVIADDILIFGKGNDEKEARNNHDNNLRALLDRCKYKNIKLNKEKIKLRQKELLYMGHIIPASGIKPDPRKCEAVKAMKTPTDKK